MSKYHRWYDALMARARAPRVLDEYVERHHELPRALGGWNDSSNIVVLTFREHFLAHWLLTKFTGLTEIERRKMLYALSRMASRHNAPAHLIAKWRYPIARRAALEASVGRRNSDEAKARMRVAQVKSPAQRAKIAAGLTGHARSQASIDHQKATLATKDRSKNEATREKMRQAALRRYRNPAERKRTGLAAKMGRDAKGIDQSGANNPRFGVTMSDETKALITQRAKERYAAGFVGPTLGRTRTEAERRAISAAVKAAGPLTAEQRQRQIDNTPRGEDHWRHKPYARGSRR